MNKILIIEDDSKFADVTRLALRKFRDTAVMDILICGDNIDGPVTTKLNEFKPELVIIDSLEGAWEEVVKNIHNSLPETKICLFTGNKAIINRVEGNLGEYGLTAVLSKGDQLMSGLPDFVGNTIDGSLISPGSREKL